MATPDTRDPLAVLRLPFPAEQIGQRPFVTCAACTRGNCADHASERCEDCGGRTITTAHAHNSFVGHAHLTERLLEADPEWTWEPVAFDPSGLPALDASHGLWIRLIIHTADGRPVSRLGYGSAGYGEDRVKELIGDALRNAAMRFGAALDLWKSDGVDRTVTPGRPGLPATPDAGDDARVPLWDCIRAISAARCRRDNSAVVDHYEAWYSGLALADVPPGASLRITEASGIALEAYIAFVVSETPAAATP